MEANIDIPLTRDTIIYSKIEPLDMAGNGKLDASFAVSSGIVDQWGDPSIILRFYISDPMVTTFIEVRDGGGFTKLKNIPIKFNKIYHCWFVVHLKDKKYDVYVQPADSIAPVLLATNATFRNSAVTQLDHWCTYHNTGTPSNYIKLHTFALTKVASLNPPTAINTLSDSFELFDVYPNPVTSNVTFNYRLKETLKVELTLYNIQGQKVKTIVTGKQNSGEYKYTTNVSDLRKGIYFYKFTGGDYSTTKKILIH